MSNLELIDIVHPRNHDRAFFFDGALKNTGVVPGSHAGLKKALKAGTAPTPRKLPNGRLFWFGSDFAKFLKPILADKIEALAASEPEAD